MDIFRSYLDNLNTIRDNDDLPCAVELNLFPNVSSIHVRFHSPFEAILHDDGETRFNTVFNAEDSTKRDILMSNSVSYGCAGPDVCEKEFLFKYVQWIIQTTFNEFQQVIRPLMTNETAPKGRCAIGTDTTKKCAQKICAASVYNIGKSEIETLTYSSYRSEPCYLAISTCTYAQANATEEKENQKFWLRCNYNDCNSQTNVAKVKHAIETYYNTVLLNGSGSDSGNIHNDTTTIPSLQSFNNDSCTVKITWIVFVLLFLIL